MESPLYRCAVEVGFLPAPQEILIAKNGFAPGYGTRVEQDDRFSFDGETIGSWFDPLNEAAKERAQALFNAKKRKSVGAVNAAPTTPVQPPRSGISGTFSTAPIPQHAIRDVRTDVRMPEVQSAPPRRRAAKG